MSRFVAILFLLPTIEFLFSSTFSSNLLIIRFRKQERLLVINTKLRRYGPKASVPCTLGPCLFHEILFLVLLT